MPENDDPTSRVHGNAALYEPEPPRLPKPKEVPRKNGAWLPAVAEWATDAAQPRQTVVCDRYGLHATRTIKVRQALGSWAGGSRLLTIVLTRDAGGGGRPDAMLDCTRSDWTVL